MGGQPPGRGARDGFAPIPRQSAATAAMRKRAPPPIRAPPPPKPLAGSERLTIRAVRRPRLTRAPRGFGPPWPPSARAWRLSGASRPGLANTPGAPSRSRILAACPAHTIGSPPAPVRIWRFRPLILLPASNPESDAVSEGFTRSPVGLNPWRQLARLSVAPARGPGTPAPRLARRRDRVAVDPGQPGIVAPAVGLIARRRDRRKALRRQRPPASGRRDVPDPRSRPGAIARDRTCRGRAAAAARFSLAHRSDRPDGASSRAAVPRAGEFGPGDRVPGSVPRPDRIATC